MDTGTMMVQYGMKDRISHLPMHLIDNILECLSLRDVARTSILSRTWRNFWATCPRLVFDRQFVEENIRSKGRSRDVLAVIIYRVLSLHVGPILKFDLYIPRTRFDISSDIDLWIHFLSRNGVKELTIVNSGSDPYKMSPHFFTCLELTHLHLVNCILKPPHAFHGFKYLVSLKLDKISFSSNLLQTLIPSDPVLRILEFANCTGMENLRIHAPRLRKFELFDSYEFQWLFSESTLHELVEMHLSLDPEVENTEQGKTITLVKLLCYLPNIVTLDVNGCCLKLLAADNVRKFFPTTVSYLRDLTLGSFEFNDLDQIFGALFLLSSSPSLKNLEINGCNCVKNGVEKVLNYLEAQGSMNMTFYQLQTVEIDIFGSPAELAFLKLLLAHSPCLERMLVRLFMQTDAGEGLRISRELMQSPRASKAARVVFH